MIKMQFDAPIKVHSLALLRLGKELKDAIRPILASLASAGKRQVQRNMIAYLGRRTGWLRKHVYGVRRSDSLYVVAAPRHIAEPLERGATIVPKKGKYLTFKLPDGSWIKAKSVTIPARHWFTKSIAGFEDSPEYITAIDKGIAKAVRKFGQSAVTTL